jgi:hypothetical protein
MISIFSKQKPAELLHIINKYEPEDGRKELVEPQNFLQVAVLNLNEGQRFLPHKHIWKELGSLQTIAQESWVVIKGTIQVNYFDLDDSFLCSHNLSEGDASITLFGGHSYTILEKAYVYEFKSGPYLGQEKDKIFIENKFE